MKKLTDIPNINKPYVKLSSPSIQAFSGYSLIMILINCPSVLYAHCQSPTSQLNTGYRYEF